jgi:predicted  nucleic acid-binding Zn-ribbon protein
MQIPKEYLDPKNYQGTRLVEITDKKVLALRKDISAFQPQAKPFLDEVEKYGKELDPYYKQIVDLQEQINNIKKKMGPAKEIFDKNVAELEKIEQKSQLIKNKIQPIVTKLMENELGEFETMRKLVDKDDKLFVEVVDELEEKITQIRKVKANKKV